MKRLLYLTPALTTMALMTSCTNDLATIDITYQKASAVYADLEEIRDHALIVEAREISNPGKIFVADELLLIGEEMEGVHVIDNGDPENPVNSLFINIPGNREFFVKDNSLYAESYYDMLKIDFSDPKQPVLFSRAEYALGHDLTNDQGQSIIGFDFETVTERFEVQDDFHHLIQPNEINFFDFANQLIPPSAVPSSFAGNSDQTIGTVNRIVTYSEYVYVLGYSHLTILQDGGTLEFISNTELGQQMETIFPFGDKLFIGTQNSMEIFDLSNPERPEHISTFGHATSCDPVYPVGDVAYVTLRTGDFSNCRGDINALVVLDITRIDDPHPVQEIEMESPYGMSMIGTDLYVGEGENGLKIFNATDKRSLILDKWDKNIRAYDVITHPSRLDIVLIAGPDGLGQYGIQNTGSITLLSNLAF